MVPEYFLHKLDLYDYKYNLQKDSVEIKLGLSQNVIVDFSEQNKILIKDQLKPWNPLTGIIQMSMKSAVVYNTIALIVLLVIMFLLGMPNFIKELYFLLWIFIPWMLLWTIYYHVKAEHFKTTIVRWLDIKS